ncbi:hypothetical protein ABK040_009270 [Willaertia magna]
MSISFSSDPTEQQEHVEGLLNEGLFECLLFSMGCDNYQIKTFENIENEIMKKELKKIKFETIPLQKMKKLNEVQQQPTFVSYNNNDQPLEQIHDNELLHLIKFEKKHILEDCWKLIIHYIPIQDFNSFLKVCKFFYSILTETIYFKNMKNLVYKFTTQNYDNVQDNFLQLVDNQLVREYFYHKQRDKHYLNILEDNNKLINIFENITDRNKRNLPKFLQDRELTNLEYNLLKFIISKGLISYLKCLPNHWFTKNNNELYLFCLQYPIQYAFDFIPKELQNDRNICLQFITKNHPYLFTKLSKELQEDKEIILTCLDNLINLNQTIPIPNEIRIKINRDPEILIKLFTMENRLPNIVPNDLLINYEGKPLYYKLIEINAYNFYHNFLKYSSTYNNLILKDKDIYKYVIKSDCLEILNSMPNILILDYELAKELILLNTKVICFYLNCKSIRDKYYIKNLLNLLPDVTNFESSIADSYPLTRNIDADIDLLIRKLGVSKYLFYQNNLDYHVIINIFGKYSTRLYDLFDYSNYYYNRFKYNINKIRIQKGYIEYQRSLQNKSLTSTEIIYIEPLSEQEVESLLFDINNDLALEVIKKVPKLYFYSSSVIQEKVLKNIFYLFNTKEEKIFSIQYCNKQFILKNNLSFKFLENCLFIAPHLLNYETKEFFIDKFIPLLIKYILNNGLTNDLKRMLQQIILPEYWREDKDFLEQVINKCENYNLDIKFGIILTLNIKNKTIATQLLKENIEYWNLFDDKIKLDKSILNSLLTINLNNNYGKENTFLENFLLPLLLKQQKVTDYIDAFKMIIEVNPTLINLFPKELQLNYNILQVIFDKDILNCVNYLPIEILDSFKFLMFDSVDSSKRKVLLQQFKERYNKELNLQ